MQHEAICDFPSEEFYEGKLITDESVKRRPSNGAMEDFWPRGNEFPIMFVDVVGDEEIGNAETSETKVGEDSKCNAKEAKLVVCKLAIIMCEPSILIVDCHSQATSH